MTRYCPDAVNACIASSNRHGRKIGKREATAIHRLLAGRTPSRAAIASAEAWANADDKTRADAEAAK